MLLKSDTIKICTYITENPLRYYFFERFIDPKNWILPDQTVKTSRIFTNKFLRIKKVFNLLF